MTTQAKLTKAEQTTNIIYDQASPDAEIHTHDPALQAKLEELGYEVTDTEGDGAQVYMLPKNLVNVGVNGKRPRAVRVSTRTPEQKAEKFMQLRRGRWMKRAGDAGEDPKTALARFTKAFAADRMAEYSAPVSGRTAAKPAAKPAAAPAARKPAATRGAARNAGL